LKDFRLDLIHGRMSPGREGRRDGPLPPGQTQVLVATSVVEVGIDVPNATLMTIEGGERFGLAQLHQLRGRISRGSHPGFLCVFASPPTDEASRSGWKLSSTPPAASSWPRSTFSFRGPGDIFGAQQHGLPRFRIADLARDAAILEEARAAAQTLVAADPKLRDPQHDRLRKLTLTRYGKALELGDVG
jgi:ATP-dependent DNA helicase RecG